MTDRVTVEVEFRGRNAASAASASVRRDIDQTQRSVAGLNQQFQRVNSALGMIGAGVSLAAVKNLTEQLYTSGMEAQRARTLYESFGDVIGNTAGLMDRLRDSTRGTVTDVALMNAASAQLSMGLARNADDVERLTTIGVTFAQAMGTDVSASLENLNMILANQSYLRLDSLGISSAQVRELSEGYRASGMDSAEAFTAAFLEVAEGKLPQMAAVADATVTPFQQLTARWENFWTDFGDRFAQGVNGIIGLLDILGQKIGELPDYLAEVVTNPEIPAGLIADNAGLPAAMPGNPMMSAAMYRQYLQMQASAGNYGLISPYQMAAYDLPAIVRQSQMDPSAVAQLLNGYTGGYMGGSLYDAARAQQWATSQSVIGGAGLLGVGDMGGAQFLRPVAALEEQMQRLQSLLGGGTTRGGLQIISPETAANAENMAYAIEQTVERLAGAGLNETLLAPLRAAAEQSRAGADAAAQWAENLANMSLSQLFGQTGGGRLGEIDAAILGQLEAEGASDATLEALRTAMGLNTGQITELSQQFEQDVTPQLAAIASQYGADAVIAARTAYEQAVQAAALAGSTRPLNLPEILGYETWGGGSGTQQFTVNPGDTPGAVAARTGMTVDQVLAATGAANVYAMPTGTFGGGAGFSTVVPAGFEPTEWATAGMDIETSFANAETSSASIVDDMTTAVDTLSRGLDKVFAPTYDLKARLVLEGNDTFSQMIAAAVTANGGQTPGQSGFTGKSKKGSYP